MEPRTSTRSGQIATNTPLKNAFGQRWAIHKIQLSRKWRRPGSPFPRGYSKGDNINICQKKSLCHWNQKIIKSSLHVVPTGHHQCSWRRQRLITSMIVTFWVYRRVAASRSWRLFTLENTREMDDANVDGSSGLVVIKWSTPFRCGTSGIQWDVDNEWNLKHRTRFLEGHANGFKCPSRKPTVSKSYLKMNEWTSVAILRGSLVTYSFTHQEYIRVWWVFSGLGLQQ